MDASMSIERKYYAFLASTRPRPPYWDKVPAYVREAAGFIERNARASKVDLPVEEVYESFRLKARPTPPAGHELDEYAQKFFLFVQETTRLECAAGAAVGEAIAMT